VLDWTVQETATYALYDGFSTPPDLTLRCREPDNLQFATCPHSCAAYQAAWAASGYEDFVVTDTITDSELTRYAVGAGGTREFASQTDVIQREIQDLQVDYDGVGGNPPETFVFCDEVESVTNNVELLDAQKNPPKPLAVGDFAGNTLAIPIIYDPDDGAPNYSSGLFLDFVTLNDDPDQDGWRTTSTLLSGVTPDWRIVDGNELQFDYGGGVVQTLRQLEPTLDLETAFWMEVNGVPQAYGRYDIALSVDSAFQFTEPYLVNDTGEFWNAVVLNGWQKVLWQTNALGQFELLPGASFGWEFAAIPTVYNVFPGDALLADWEILAAPLSAGLGQLQNLPAGTMHIYQIANNRDRYWIPIAESSVSVPADVAHASTPRKRFYVLEHRYRASNDVMDIPPRINALELFDKTVLD
jgi:hypothetical protein